MTGRLEESTGKMFRPVDRESTPEGRLAAVASNLLLDMHVKFRHLPDYADFRDAFRLQIERELVVARLGERLTRPGQSESRNNELELRLEAIDREIERETKR